MNADRHTLRCPDPETIAALAEGRLESSRVDAVLEHVEHCRSCMDALDAASAAFAMEQERSRPARRGVAPIWRLVAAAIVVIGVSVFGIREWIGKRGPSMATLVELAPRAVRLVEPRLSGGFAWAPYRGPMRAGGAVSDTERMRLGGVAADALDRADRDTSSAAQHVAGVAILLADDPQKSLDRLRLASERAPNDARIANDLAAARYAAALALDRASLYADALAAADRALRIDPQLPEAMFNRALILERLGLTQEARRAWERYLAVDPSSPWADEARRRLAKLPVTTSESLFKRELERLDLRNVSAFVKRFPQQSRTFAEAEHLGLWAEATLRGDAAEAARQLATARAIGEALSTTSRESLLRDAVAAIDRADSRDRMTLAHAHAAYRTGRKAYATDLLVVGERDLRSAARGFADARSPMALEARYFAACARFDRHEVAARGELDSLLRELESYPDYAALRAQTRWELALCDMVDNDWAAAVVQLTAAEMLFERLGERSNLSFIQSLLATALMSLGRPDEGWAARAHAFAGLGFEGRANRLAVAIAAAARMELRAGRLETARALLTVEVAEARAAGDDVMLADALVRSALASKDEGDPVVATMLARESLLVASRISDRSLRDRALADARVADGAVRLAGDPRGAIESLSAAIDFYAQHDFAIYLPAPFLYRARAAMRLGNSDEALLDLDRGIAEIERHAGVPRGFVVAPVVLEAGDSLFEDAIRASLERGDARRAFGYAERARGHAKGACTLDDLQSKLRGTATVVLHLTSLPDEVVAFAVTSNDVMVARTRFARERFEVIDDRTAELFDVLIRPSERALERARELIVIADPRLQRIPFAALYDARRRTYLIERVAVATAPSASSLEALPAVQARSVTAVTLPTGDRSESQRLPATDSEPAEIVRLYRAGHVIPTSEATFRAIRDAAAGNDVVHIAGHTARQKGNDDTALLLAGGERVSWTAIAATPIARRTVFVLAGCETLRNASGPYVRSMSIGAAFVAAGAGSAIGTLSPIADEDAREIFLEIHRQLAAGVGPAEAVRQAQLDAIASGRLPAWRSIALTTCCIWR